jgi:hypothetical protein
MMVQLLLAGAEVQFLLAHARSGGCGPWRENLNDRWEKLLDARK